MALEVYKNAFYNKKHPVQIAYIRPNYAQFHPVSSDPENFGNTICEPSPWGVTFSWVVVSAFFYNFVLCATDYLQTQTIPFRELALARWHRRVSQREHRNTADARRRGFWMRTRLKRAPAHFPAAHHGSVSHFHPTIQRGYTSHQHSSRDRMPQK